MSAKPPFLDKKYTVIGDALLNAAATLNTVIAGRPKSVRVRNKILSEAFKRAGIESKRRHDKHQLAEMYEGIVGFVYMNLNYSFESLSNLLIGLLNDNGEEEAYTKFIKGLLEEIKREGVA